MQNKELDLLFEDINRVIRQVRDLQEENFEAGIVDSVTSNCEYLFGTYEELYTDLVHWKMPNNLELDEEDQKWLRILLKNFADDVENLLKSLHSN